MSKRDVSRWIIDWATELGGRLNLIRIDLDTDKDCVAVRTVSKAGDFCNCYEGGRMRIEIQIE
jgi:phosphoribosyl-AMP cyclohydrolase